MFPEDDGVGGLAGPELPAALNLNLDNRNNELAFGSPDVSPHCRVSQQHIQLVSDEQQMKREVR